MNVDFGAAAKDYATHRQGFPDALYERLFTIGIVQAGYRVLDLGTGTGAVAIALAERGCKVTAIDISEALIEKAKEKAVHLDMKWVVSSAEAFADDQEPFHLVVAGQCWHWFERATVAKRMFRLLRDQGTLLMIHLDWLSTPDSIVERSLQTLFSFGAKQPKQLTLGIDGIYPYWFADLHQAAYRHLESFSFDIPLNYAKTSWIGRLKASALFQSIGDPADKLRCEEALADILSSEVSIVSVPHRVFAVWGKK